MIKFEFQYDFFMFNYDSNTHDWRDHSNISGRSKCKFEYVLQEPVRLGPRINRRKRLS